MDRNGRTAERSCQNLGCSTLIPSLVVPPQVSGTRNPAGGANLVTMLAPDIHGAMLWQPHVLVSLDLT